MTWSTRELAVQMLGAIDTVNGSAIGWPGWIVYSAIVTFGFAAIRRRRRRDGVAEKELA